MLRRWDRCEASRTIKCPTPSVESYANALGGKYAYVTLKSRVQNRPMPKTHFVDLKDKENWYCPEGSGKPLHWLSSFLVGKIGKTVRDKQQAMLFLNRLGLTPMGRGISVPETEIRNVVERAGGRVVDTEPDGEWGLRYFVAKSG